MSVATAPWLIIGNPENRRVSLFQDALQRAGLPPAHVLSYLDILEQRVSLPDSLAKVEVVRIESPGENFAVEQRLLALGGVEHALHLEEERGRIYYPGHWFRGFSHLMATLAKSAPEHTLWFNHPDDIVALFDKPRCKALLQPYTLPEYPTFADYAAFQAFAAQQARPRFFIKLNYSSSASGVVAYEYNKRLGIEQAYSTVEMVARGAEPRFYNSLKIKKYTDRPTIRAIVDFLLQQGALVEPWVPKARHQSWSYDLRVLAIGQQRCHAIARLSHGPMTNLHLGNQRCNVEALGLPASYWQQIDQLVESVMRQFPRSLYAGLDVLWPRDGEKPFLLEANAFGDLLPHLLHQGMDTYQYEIMALLQRHTQQQSGVAP